MHDRDCISLLQWALPRLGHRWQGYRHVRRQVCRRIDARIRLLGLDDAAAYRRRLETDSAEWAALRDCLPVSISRFYRDRGVFQVLADRVLPGLAHAAQTRGARSLHAWSAGCASGEEAYSLSLLWAFQLRARHPGLGFSVLATDADATMLQRAKAACYRASSLRELPSEWRERAFTRENGCYCLLPSLRACVDFQQQDLCTELPRQSFDLILCRNLAFTYFDQGLQRGIAAALAQRLAPAGCLLLGAHERLPGGVTGIAPWPGLPGFYRKAD